MEAYKIEQLSKQYSDKVLFDNITFSIAQGEKVALTGINGTGKSALMKCIANIEHHTGIVTHPKNFIIGYAAQEPNLDEDDNAINNIIDDTSEVSQLLKTYDSLATQLASNLSVMDTFNEVQSKLEQLDGFNYLTEAKTILTKLGIMDHNSPVSLMSGGQKKRIALARTLLMKPDLLLLDEPTNHLDFESITWLINYIKSYKKAILVVTHDRYFLNEVATRIVELRNASLFSYIGNYNDYIMKKAEEEEQLANTQHKEKQLYKAELAWMRKGAKARTTKQQARIDRFSNIESNVKAHTTKESMSIDLAHQRLGKQVFEMENLSKAYPSKVLIEDFSVIVQTTDRIGIVGENGSGKSTLLNILSGETDYSGELKIGQTVKIGYYKQALTEMDEDLRMIDFLRLVQEEAVQSDGQKISITQLLERFLFPSQTHGTLVRSLSGGEKKRLYLLSILIQGPNVLLLDEPTNDLDTETLTILEQYLSEMNGAVLTVSHDRYFLNKVVDQYWYIHDGYVERILGDFDDYIEARKARSASVKEKKVKKTSETTRVSYKEKRRFEFLSEEIERLEKQIETIQQDILQQTTNYELLGELTKEEQQLNELYEIYFMEWSELAERME